MEEAIEKAFVESYRLLCDNDKDEGIYLKDGTGVKFRRRRFITAFNQQLHAAQIGIIRTSEEKSFADDNQYRVIGFPFYDFESTNRMKDFWAAFEKFVTTGNVMGGMYCDL